MLRLAGCLQDSIVDGPGLRTVLFFQGCPHRCEGCHNPETWDFAGGVLYTPQQIVAMVQQNPLCGGVTLSGGEPFAQAGGAMQQLLQLLRQGGYELAAYSGYTFEQLLQGSEAQRQMLGQVDVLIDGRFVQQQQSYDALFRGSSNQRILNVPLSLAAGRPVAEQSSRWQTGGAADSGSAL